MTSTLTTLPGYNLSQKLYQGSRTLVYRGHKMANGQAVVIKLMKNEYPSFSELVQFRNQYVITKNLNLPGIVKSIALERYENRYALIMEDTVGISLAEYKQQSSLSLGEFLEIAIQLAEILHQLHNNSIIHKDIKPANILIHPKTKQIKLIDFSISTLLPKETQTIQTPNVLEGTLAYLSPEQTGRMNRGIDYRSDFYSLGVTFYELLTKTLPFNSDDPLELIHAHIAQSPEPIAQCIGLEEQFCPQPLSALIMKLMAKNAEERYHSALGLKYDLEKCLAQYGERGKIEPFELGERDICSRFLIPEKLYGREKEVAQLLAAFNRVAFSHPSPDCFPSSEGLGVGSPSSHTELVLVAGFSGIGKTAVIEEVHKPITRQKGYFIQGKFDQFNRNIPFSAFVQAFRRLMGQLLGESDTALAAWKAKILDAVGESGQVIVEVIPELAAIVGEQPPVPELSGSAAQNRFNRLFSQFVRAIATPEHPLVIFLDDLQWADSASLNLLKLLMEESELGHLLILGAYRDNEVFPAHPLMLCLDEVEKLGGQLETLTLEPLSESDINQLVADTLLCEVNVAAPLSELTYQKTQGNPFFTTQFLQGLHEEGCIAFEVEAGYWQCNMARVRDLALTDDVVEFMVGRLQKLPAETQEVLKLAACIDNRFDLQTLATVCDRPSQAEVAADLWCVLQEGLVVPESETYKFFQGGNREVEHLETISVSYRFLHDRVQQAAYSLIPDEQKQSTHLAIGRLLLQNIPDEQQQERIFEIVSQLNEGIPLITQPTERDALAQLNLIAGRKAKSATAYQAGRKYASTGLLLLGEQAWQRQYKLTLEFHDLAAELASLCGDFEAMEQWVEAVIARANSLLENVNVYRINIQSHVFQNRATEAIAIAQTFLQQLGVSFPETPEPKDLQQIIAEIGSQIGDREIEDLIHLPMMADEEKIAAVQIASSIIPAAKLSGSPLFPLLVAWAVKLSIQYGNTLASALAYSFYGVIVCHRLQDVNAGVKFGQLALDVVSQLDAKSVKPEVFSVVTTFVLHRKYHIQETLPLLQEGYTTGLEVGSLEFLGYSAQGFCRHAFWCAQPLTRLEQETRTYCQALVQLNQVTTANWCRIYWQTILNLLKATDHPSLLSGEALQEAEFLPSLISTRNLLGLYYFYTHKLMLAYLFEEFDLARDYAVELEPYLKAGTGTVVEPAFYFYDSLTTLAQLNSQPEARAKQLEQVDRNQRTLQQHWADYAPMNYQHKVSLVAAEKCRVLGQNYEASEWYDRAIAGAKEHKYIQEEALANELAAKFYLNWGRDKFAALYLQEAYYCYARWGAKAKTDALEQDYPQLLEPIFRQPQNSLSFNKPIGSLQTATISSSITSTDVNQLLDLASIVKAFRTLSEAIELDRAIANLMQVILENAGAETVTLMLFRSGVLYLEAQVIDGRECPVEAVPIEDSQAVPLTLVNTVKRTQTPLILADATQETDYAGDPYIEQYQPRSILCLPLSDRGRAIGILYLENNQVTGAFTSDRVEVLALLCTQAAITLENARLYQQARQALQLEKELHELQRTQLQLIQSEKMFSLGQMVGGIAHEINNPLTFIEGNILHSSTYMTDLIELLDLYQQHHPQVHPDIREKIDRIDLMFIKKDLPNIFQSMHVGTERIQKIVSSLRTFARLDESQWKAVDLHEGIDSALTILHSRLHPETRQRKIQVIKEYGKLPRVQCYAGQLNQVFMNLLNNAIDALEDNESQTAPIIRIRTQTDGNTVTIAISDNGIGISEKTKSRLFDPFFTTKPVGKGTGLGLSISHQIITEQHQGQLSCTSQEGETIFSIEIPIR